MQSGYGSVQKVTHVSLEKHKVERPKEIGLKKKVLM